MSKTIAVSVFLALGAFLVTWTVGTHAVTLGGLEYPALYAVFAMGLVAAAASSRCLRPVERVFFTDACALPKITLNPQALQTYGKFDALAVSILTLAFIAGFAVLYLKTIFMPLWGVCLATGAYALWRGRRETADWILRLDTTDPAPPTSILPGFLFVSVLLLTTYFFTSVPDTDDSLFLNMAVGAKTDPGAVLQYDSMLGIPSLELLKSTYRLEAHVLLASIISDLGRVPVIVAAHAIIPALMCLFAASVLTLMHVALFRRAWLATALFHLAILMAMDGSLISYGYHGIFRFIQGKGLFVTILAPLIVFLTVQYILTRQRSALVLLSLAVILAIGMTANAIYVATLAIAFTGAPFLLMGSNAQRLGCLRLIFPVLYPGALAAYLIFLDPPAPSEFTTPEPIGVMLWGLMGSKYMLVLGTGLLFVGAAAAAFNRRLMFVSLYAIVLLLAVLNPALWEFYARNVTGYINVRLMWIVPLPFIFAILAGIVWQSLPSFWALGVPAVLVLGMAAPGSMLHKTSFGLAPIKVHQPAYDLATDINEAAKDTIILAPEYISAWLTTLDNALPVVEGRSLYLPQRKQMLSEEDLAARSKLYSWVNGQPGMELDLEDAIPLIDRIGVQMVVTRDGSPAHETMQAAASYGFTPVIARDGITAFLREAE